ncbi:MAG: Bug family tripartite tricarboxylate transporter substrate binding protein [Burkholderiales bacterium]
MNKTRAIVYSAFLAMLGATHLVFGQTYPSRPINVVNPWPPGAVTDMLARLVAEGLRVELGQPVIVENRTGASGTLGSAYVAKSKPDGYTLLVTVSSPITTNQFLQKNYPFDPLKDLEPISMATESALVFAVHPSLPVRTMEEFVEYARKNPGKLSYGTAGLGTAHHIVGETLKRDLGIDMVHVPFRGGAPAAQALVANTVPTGFNTVPSILQQARAGRARILATTRRESLPDLPDVPPISRVLPGFESVSWVGFFAPGGTAQPILQRLNAAIVKVIKSPEIADKARAEGNIVVGSTAEALGKQVRAEIEKWGPIIKSLGIQNE